MFCCGGRAVVPEIPQDVHTSKTEATISPFLTKRISLPDEINKLEILEPKIKTDFHQVLKVPVKPAEGDEVLELSYKDIIASRSVSTYPWQEGAPFRDGEPICDHVCVSVFPERLIVTLADGCGWGSKPRLAAESACDKFIKELERTVNEASTIGELTELLLHSLEAAHNAIITQKENLWEVGTTTLLAGIQVEMRTASEDPDERSWAFVGIGVGDAKLIHWDSKKRILTDCSTGNRPSDPSDCGGRIGPQLEGGAPDLRNLRYYFVPISEGDIVGILSDGVHDNLDPQYLGVAPEELKVQGFSDWGELESEEVQHAKTRYREDLLMNKFIEPSPDPKAIANLLVEHCLRITEPGRVFMETNPGRKLPVDYVLYPGKMDHSSCVIWRVVRNYSS